jgi:hypothetical protein
LPIPNWMLYFIFHHSCKNKILFWFLLSRTVFNWVIWIFDTGTGLLVIRQYCYLLDVFLCDQKKNIYNKKYKKKHSINIQHEPIQRKVGKSNGATHVFSSNSLPTWVSSFSFPQKHVHVRKNSTSAIHYSLTSSTLQHKHKKYTVHSTTFNTELPTRKVFSHLSSLSTIREFHTS